MSSLKNNRGEIATIITLGSLLVLTVTSLAANIFLKKPQVVKTKAAVNSKVINCSPNQCCLTDKCQNSDANPVSPASSPQNARQSCVNLNKCDICGGCNTLCCDPDDPSSFPPGSECIADNGYCQTGKAVYWPPDYHPAPIQPTNSNEGGGGNEKSFTDLCKEQKGSYYVECCAANLERHVCKTGNVWYCDFGDGQLNPCRGISDPYSCVFEKEACKGPVPTEKVIVREDGTTVPRENAPNAANYSWLRCDDGSNSCDDFCINKGLGCNNKCSGNKGMFQEEVGQQKAYGLCNQTITPLTNWVYNGYNLQGFCNINFNVYCCCGLELSVVGNSSLSCEISGNLTLRKGDYTKKNVQLITRKKEDKNFTLDSDIPYQFPQEAIDRNTKEFAYTTSVSYLYPNNIILQNTDKIFDLFLIMDGKQYKSTKSYDCKSGQVSLNIPPELSQIFGTSQYNGTISKVSPAQPAAPGVVQAGKFKLSGKVIYKNFNERIRKNQNIKAVIVVNDKEISLKSDDTWEYLIDKNSTNSVTVNITAKLKKGNSDYDESQYVVFGSYSVEIPAESDLRSSSSEKTDIDFTFEATGGQKEDINLDIQGKIKNSKSGQKSIPNIEQYKVRIEGFFNDSRVFNKDNIKVDSNGDYQIEDTVRIPKITGTKRFKFKLEAIDNNNSIKDRAEKECTITSDILNCTIDIKITLNSSETPICENKYKKGDQWCDKNQKKVFVCEEESGKSKSTSKRDCPNGCDDKGKECKESVPAGKCKDTENKDRQEGEYECKDGIKSVCMGNGKWQEIQKCQRECDENKQTCKIDSSTCKDPVSNADLPYPNIEWDSTSQLWKYTEKSSNSNKCLITCFDKDKKNRVECLTSSGYGYDETPFDFLQGSFQITIINSLTDSIIINKVMYNTIALGLEGDWLDKDKNYRDQLFMGESKSYNVGVHCGFGAGRQIVIWYTKNITLSNDSTVSRQFSTPKIDTGCKKHVAINISI